MANRTLSGPGKSVRGTQASTQRALQPGGEAFGVSMLQPAKKTSCVAENFVGLPGEVRGPTQSGTGNTRPADEELRLSGHFSQ
jgi:hypothetical protein